MLENHSSATDLGHDGHRALPDSWSPPLGPLPADVPQVESRGPFFDELSLGPFASAPGLTLSDGLAAHHRAVLGDRFPLALDAELARTVVGVGPLADPALVWDVSIGQSTLVTQQVRANLFYRGVHFHRAPAIGDTLRTHVEIVGLRANRPKPGRAPTGMAVLRITTTDQQSRAVLDFWRCAMLPCSPDSVEPVAAGERIGDHPDPFGQPTEAWEPPGFIRTWNLSAMEGLVPAFDPSKIVAPMRLVVAGGDVVSSAPELARLTLNTAMVHTDRFSAGGRRLVYGGHTIGIAAAQTARALPSAVTVLGWHSCDHVGPVHEGDTLFSTIEVHRITRLDETSQTGRPGFVADLRSVVTAVAPDETDRRSGRPVLDWRYVVLL